MNIKKTIQLMTLVSLTGSQCWGAAAPTFEEKKRERDEKILGGLIPDTQEQILLHLDPNKLRELIVINPEFAKFPAVKKIGQLLGKNNWNVQNALFDAAQNNMPWAIDYLVTHGAQINAQDKLNNNIGKTALIGAVKNDDIAAVEQLLAKGAEGGYTALIYAAANGNNAIVAKLLAAGADPNIADPIGKTALIKAAENGHTEIVKQLLEAGATVDHAEKFKNFYDNKSDFINIALTKENEKNPDDDIDSPMKNLLMSAKEFGFTALMHASINGHDAVIEQLLAAGADPNFASNPIGTTALMMAAQYGHDAIVKRLLDSKAIVDTTDWVGMTALMGADSADVVKLLLAAGANVNATSDYGDTALIKSIPDDDDYKSDTIELIKLLLTAGANVNAANQDGETALTQATEEGHTAIVELLLQHGATFDEETKTKIEALGVEIPGN